MSERVLKTLRLDPVMEKLIDRVGPFKLVPRRLSPFESLVSAIVHQQLSGAAAKTIYGRFLDLFRGDEFPSPQRVLKMPSDKLRSAGLSRAKVSYILDTAERAKRGLIPSLEKCDEMDDMELIECLTETKGIGRWTAEMLLIFNLGRLDVLPVDDLGVRKGYKIAYKKRDLPSPKYLARKGEIWAPYRSSAAWYLWRAADMLKDGSW